MSNNPQMTPRQALLLTADFIEQHPQKFDFNQVEQPSGPSCGTPGCALGWLAALAGLQANTYGSFDSAAIMAFMGIPRRSGGGYDAFFYDKMNRIDKDWDANASRCARAMRLFADQYYPVEVTK